MKTKTTLLFVFIAIIAFSFTASDDFCGLNYKEGSSFTYQSTNAKGKITGKSVTTMESKKALEDGVEYSVKSESFDEKNKSVGSGSFKIRCKSDVFSVEISNYIDQSMLKGMENMEIKASGMDMKFPKSLSVGQTLDDATINIQALSNGFSVMNMNVDVKNRKVLAKESVTVPAGTFDCYKISFDVETKVMFLVKSSVIQYFNFVVGEVKTETYDKAGKLINVNTLVEYKY